MNSPRECYRYQDQVQYPTGGFALAAGGLTPNVFAKGDGRGQVLVHGLESNVLVSVIESQTASWNNSEQGLATNKSVTSSACLVSCAHEEYNAGNPGCVYIRFVKAHLKKQQFAGLMATHAFKLSQASAERARRAAVKKARE